MRNPDREKAAERAATALRSRLGLRSQVQIAIVLGTGWGDVLPRKGFRRVHLGEVRGFEHLLSLPVIPGHARTLEYGSLGGKKVLLLRGRLHLNEAPNDQRLTKMVRLQVEMLFHLGVRTLVLTCAAGSLPNAQGKAGKFRPGDVVVINDLDTLHAPPLPLWAGEFPPYNGAISEKLLSQALGIRLKGLRMRTGVYAMLRGPGFETWRDKLNLAREGADVVGMSMLPELAVAALYPDVGALPLAFVTNDDKEHDHDTNRRRAHESADLLRTLLERIVSCC